MQKLQRLTPEIKRVQAKYKQDKQRQQQEMMKLYKEHGVNPLSSCLPFVVQMPVLYALFFLLRREPAGRHLPAAPDQHTCAPTATASVPQPRARLQRAAPTTARASSSSPT